MEILLTTFLLASTPDPVIAGSTGNLLASAPAPISMPDSLLNGTVPEVQIYLHYGYTEKDSIARAKINQESSEKLIPGVKVRLEQKTPPNKSTTAKYEIYNLTDTVPVIVYNNIVKKDIHYNSPAPAYYINGKFANDIALEDLNPSSIESINFNKTEKETEINGKKYFNEIHLKLKKDIISLTNLSAKYLKINEKLPTIFIIDEDPVKTDSDEVFVSEKSILKIEIHEIKTQELNANFIKIYTRTQENVEKLNSRIKIKGQSATE